MLCSLSVACGPPSTPLQGVPNDLPQQLAASLFRLGFGSCNKQEQNQDYWSVILQKQPHLWMWGGDIIYADTQDMGKMQRDYARQKEAPTYKALRTNVPVIGIWDDHDYGENDATSTYPKKAESQQLFLDFLDAPQNDPRRTQQGIYTATDYTVGTMTLKIILLDVRYFRGAKADDILGEAQWTWLEKTLQESKANIHFIVSGSQILRDSTGKDGWSTFPQSQKKLYNLLATYKTPGVLLLSGDIHVGEISKSTEAGTPYPLFEFTSSGLTHTNAFFNLKNKYRMFLLRQTNFGLIDITRNQDNVALHLQLYDTKGTLQTYHQIPLSSLQP